MTYTDYLSASETTRWLIDTDIPWDSIRPALALSDPDLLDRVRDSALIESFFPIFTPRALDLLWDNATATAIYSIQLYESYKHFQVFNQYLEAIGYRPISDEEIVEVRRRNLHLKYDNVARLLTRYMMSEHFAAHHFFKDSKNAPEPVLRQILHLVAKDEVRHCQFAFDLLQTHIKEHPDQAASVIDEALHFRHIGELVVPEMPVANKNDFAAIVAINRKVQRLTGQTLSSQLAEVLQ
jgi:hypothetical protein